MFKPLIIAAPASGSGKTTVTLGLMAAFRKRGLTVAPFKVGPDYIDPGLHAVACGRPSRNLDGWMCGEGGVRASYEKGAAGADLAIVEGVMGLFDGASGEDDAGSTAEIAKWLQGRIVLVVDARAQARSAAALVAGFVRFDPELEFAGVIFNRVASDRHEDLLRRACASTPGLPPVLGCLRRNDDIALPERHLGLATAEEGILDSARRQRLAEVVEGAVNLDGLLESTVAARRSRAVSAADASPRPHSSAQRAGSRTVRIGVAKDRAFCFYYPENLELLEAAGAELVAFSPLTDDALPPRLHGLYIGGGYPELHAERLAANTGMLADIRQLAASNRPIYAECGGLVYLSQAIEDQAMTGLFPGAARMLPRRKALGYREVTLASESLLGPADTVLRGHEFHYSELAMPPGVKRVYRVAARNGSERFEEGFAVGNVLGSYIHLHFGSHPQAAKNFVAACRNNA